MVIPKGRYWWVGVGLLILSVQLVNVAVFDNDFTHLTIWAWMLHSFVCLYRGIDPDRASIMFTLVAFSLSCFVAVGIMVIELSDRRMLADFEQETSVAMLVVGNIALHYLPPLLWLWVISMGDRPRIRAYIDKHTAMVTGAQLFFLPSYIVIFYAVSFRANREYPGNIDFSLLFGLGLLSVVLVGAFVLVFASMGRVKTAIAAVMQRIGERTRLIL